MKGSLSLSRPPCERVLLQRAEVTRRLLRRMLRSELRNRETYSQVKISGAQFYASRVYLQTELLRNILGLNITARVSRERLKDSAGLSRCADTRSLKYRRTQPHRYTRDRLTGLDYQSARSLHRTIFLQYEDYLFDLWIKSLAIEGATRLCEGAHDTAAVAVSPSSTRQPPARKTPCVIARHWLARCAETDSIYLQILVACLGFFSFFVKFLIFFFNRLQFNNDNERRRDWQKGLNRILGEIIEKLKRVTTEVSTRRRANIELKK